MGATLLYVWTKTRCAYFKPEDLGAFALFTPLLAGDRIK